MSRAMIAVEPLTHRRFAPQGELSGIIRQIEWKIRSASGGSDSGSR